MLSVLRGNSQYHFNVFGMARQVLEPATSRLQDERSYHSVTQPVTLWDIYTCVQVNIPDHIMALLETVCPGRSVTEQTYKRHLN